MLPRQLATLLFLIKWHGETEKAITDRYHSVLDEAIADKGD